MSQIQEEIRQQKPFQSPAHKAAVSLLRTSNLLVRHYTAVVGKQEITLQQYNVLRILRGSGPEGLPTLEVGDRMVEQTPGITRLLDRLEKKQLVERERNTSDRRQVIVRITRAGLALLAQLDGPVNEADVSGMSALDEQQVAQLQDLLDQIRAGLHEMLGDSR
jgi:MarR family transcriptional regulator, organic hydroperoxide resistance regulator